MKVTDSSCDSNLLEPDAGHPIDHPINLQKPGGGSAIASGRLSIRYTPASDSKIGSLAVQETLIAVNGLDQEVEAPDSVEASVPSANSDLAKLLLRVADKIRFVVDAIGEAAKVRQLSRRNSSRY